MVIAKLMLFYLRYVMYKYGSVIYSNRSYNIIYKVSSTWWILVFNISTCVLEEELCAFYSPVNFSIHIPCNWCFPVAHTVKNLPALPGIDLGLITGSGRSFGEREWLPTPEFLPGEFHGQRSLEGYSPWGCKESGATEWLNTLTFKILTNVF